MFFECSQGSLRTPRVLWVSPKEYFNQEVMEKLEVHAQKLFQYGSPNGDVEDPIFDSEDEVPNGTEY